MALRLLPDFLKQTPPEHLRPHERPLPAARSREEEAWRDWIAHVEAGRIGP
ncbi:MAG: hypothetical protein AB7E55_26615 [Pigmentiphaga sp.]